jgi:sugar phosphate isomerase/epimerase
MKSGGMMSNTIACRIASYGKYEQRAWSHLPEIGIRNIEMPAPLPAEWKTIQQKLVDCGLRATSLQAKCDIGQTEAAEVMRPQLEACAAFGAKICFLSVKAGENERAKVWERLRAIGDVAARSGVVVALETHPDLVTNAELGLQTIAAINHPNVRINFDTANVYFYNQGVTAVGELGKFADIVASIHLKDTTGGYQDWNFPALGTGVVEFPEIFRMMNARGFNGPFTMELEGTKGIERTEAEQLQYVADSVTYLRRIHAL